jgi:hypothetical protein
LSAPARTVLVLAALGVALWLAVSFRSAHLQQQAANVALEKRPSPAAVDQAIRKVRQARAWQPDAAPKLVEWRLDFRRGRRGAAAALLKQVVASEPANAEAWFYVARSAQDPRVAKAALRRFKALRRG